MVVLSRLPWHLPDILTPHFYVIPFSWTLIGRTNALHCSSFSVGKALDDMSLEEFHFGDFDHDVDCDGDTISSSLSTGLSASAFPSSMPIGIPASTLPRQQLDSISSLSQCPFGSLPLPGHDPHYLAGDLLVSRVSSQCIWHGCVFTLVGCVSFLCSWFFAALNCSFHLCINL